MSQSEFGATHLMGPCTLPSGVPLGHSLAHPPRHHFTPFDSPEIPNALPTPLPALARLHEETRTRKACSHLPSLNPPARVAAFPLLPEGTGSAPKAHLLLPSLCFLWTITFSSLCWIILPASHMQESGHFNTLWGHHTSPTSALFSALGCGQQSMPLPPAPQLLHAG